MKTEPPIYKAEPITDLGKATPIEIDLRRARLDHEHGQHRARAAQALDTIHSALGERAQKHGRVKVWPTADADAVQELRKRVDATDSEYAILAGGWNAGQGRSALERLDEARAGLEANETEAAVLDAEYDRRPWRRYIAVTDGHLHSGMWCKGGSIRPTTERNWYPWISGWEVAQAVEELGPMLCTHCFPDAPTEWTLGKPKPERCDGSSKPPVEGSTFRVGMRTYGKCTKCTETPLLTSNYVCRAHKPKPKEETKSDA
jgi:hypothetical protein